MNADLYIDEDLAGLLTPHTEAELGHLEESLRTDGLTSPLLVWPTGGRLVLLDGFARYRLAAKLGIAIRWTEMPLPSHDAAVAFRLKQQLARRNLPPIASAYLRGRLYLLMAKRQGARTDLPKGQADAHLTAKGVAERFNCSERTIRRDQRLAEAIDLIGQPKQQGADYKAQLLAGKSNLTRRGVLQLARMGRDEQKRHLDKLRAEAEARKHQRRKPPAPKAADPTSNSGADTPVIVDEHSKVAGDREDALVTRRSSAGAVECGPTTPTPISELPADIRLQHADNRTFEWPELDLCFTDPPYQDLDCYGWLGGMLGQKLQPGRLALVYASPFHLPEVLRRLTAGGLRYVTTFGIVYRLACGGKPLHGFISSNIRPVVVLSQGKPKGVGRLVHAAQVQEPSPKGLHPWQQAVEPAVHWLRRLTRPGDLVADPFLGSGTTAVVARQVGGLRFVGTEIDPNTYRTACERFATDVPTAGGSEPQIDTAAVEGLLARWRDIDPQTRLAFLCRPAVQTAIQRLNTSEGRE